MKNRIRKTGLLFSLGLGSSLALALLWLLGGGLSASSAPAGELHVCPAGCTYATIQAAVDAADPGDIIKVAQGTYNDINIREGYSQIVYHKFFIRA